MTLLLLVLVSLLLVGCDVDVVVSEMVLLDFLWVNDTLLQLLLVLVLSAQKWLVVAQCLPADATTRCSDFTFDCDELPPPVDERAVTATGSLALWLLLLLLLPLYRTSSLLLLLFTFVSFWVSDNERDRINSTLGM